MKKYLIILTITLTVLTSSCNFDSDNQSISVKKTEDSYVFEAHYPKHKTQRVVNYVEKTLNDDRLFAKVDSQKDSEVKLDHRFTFNLNAKPGYIKIRFLKNKNTEASFRTLEELCTGIREELK